MLEKYFGGGREHYAGTCTWEKVLCACGFSKNQNAFLISSCGCYLVEVQYANSLINW